MKISSMVSELYSCGWAIFPFPPPPGPNSVKHHDGDVTDAVIKLTSYTTDIVFLDVHINASVVDVIHLMFKNKQKLINIKCELIEYSEHSVSSEPLGYSREQ